MINQKNKIADDPSEIKKQSKNGSSLLLISITAATTIGTMLPIGYNIGVINSPAEHMIAWTNETIISRYNAWLTESELNILWSTVVSIFLIGGIIGSLSGSWIANKFGRKFPLLIGSILLILAAISFLCCRPANSVELLLLGRLLAGISAGIITGTGPMYLAEVAPSKLRGSTATCISLGICFGIVFGQFCSLQEILGTKDLWEYAMSLYGVFVLAALLPYFWFPESPKYLYVIVGDKDRAKYELKRLRGESNSSLIDDELAEMELEASVFSEQRSVYSVLKDHSLLLPTILVVLLMGCQQLSGLNAVWYYSVEIFKSAGLSASDAKWANLGIGFINFLSVCLSPVMLTHLNRRPLLILSSLFTGIFLIMLTLIVEFSYLAEWLSYVSIIIVLAYILAIEIGLGPIPYFIASELFESAPRSAAMALGSISSWTCNFLVGMIFPSLQQAWGAYVFIPSAIVCLALVGFLRVYMPETRNQDPSYVATLVNKGFRSKPLAAQR